jgi:mannitol-specific phosphotransferase system IIBC component
LAGDEKQQLEQAWLAKDQQLQQAVEQIRTQGLEAVAAGAEAGSVASCVATTLAADPVGRLISVEGALVESAKVSQLLADLQQVMEQDVSLDQVAALLQRGADAAAYAKTLIEQQGLEQALQTLKQMMIASQQFAQQDLGAHLQQLLASCPTKQAE